MLSTCERRENRNGPDEAQRLSMAGSEALEFHAREADCVVLEQQIVAAADEAPACARRGLRGVPGCERRLRDGVQIEMLASWGRGRCRTSQDQ